MPEVQIKAVLNEDHLRRLEGEAKRRDVPVEGLVEQMVNKLIEECERAERDGTDHPILLC